MTYIVFFALAAAIIFVPELILLYQQIRDGTLEIKISSIVYALLFVAILFLIVTHVTGIFPAPFWVMLLPLFPFAIMSGIRRHQFREWVKSPACPSWYRWYVRLIRIVTSVFCLAVVCILIWAVVSAKPH